MAKVEIEDTELAALRRQAAKAEAELEKYKDYDAIKGERDTYKTRLGELNAGREKAAFEALGVQGEKAQKFLKVEFDGLPAEGKPSDIVSWLESMKADATKIPADLAFVFQIPAAGAQPAGAAPPPAVNVPNTNAGAVTPPIVPGTFTPEQVENMTIAELRANLPALVAQDPAIGKAVEMFNYKPPTPTKQA